MDSEASRSCGPRCRPPPGELAGGRRSKPSPRFFAVGVTPSRPAARGGAGVNSGVPSPERSAPLRSSVPGLSLSSSAPHQGGAWLGEQRLMAANYVRCPRDRGESVKGGHPPFHKRRRRIGTRRRTPKACKGVAIPARSAGRFGDGGSSPRRSVIRTSPKKCPRPRTARGQNGMSSTSSLVSTPLGPQASCRAPASGALLSVAERPGD